MVASIIFYNGKIFCGDGADGYQIQSAVAVEGDYILACGPDEEILALKDAGTELVDCGGKTVLPGLCDAHCHGCMSGGMLFACDLFNIPAENGPDDVIAQIQQRLSRFLADHPDVTVLRGIGFNQFDFTPERRPTRQDLDKVCSDRPIVLESFCQHALWTNTKAIESAGLDSHTPQPASGSFEAEPDGYPSGMFHDMEGRALIGERMPGYDFTVEEYKRVILDYQKNAVSNYGVTLIQECKLSRNAVEAYKELAAAGQLQMRVRAVYPIDHPEKKDELRFAIANQAADRVGDLFGINTVKYFLEGFFVLLEPYTESYNTACGNPADYCGSLFFETETVKQSFAAAAAAGFQIHIHAMGDRTVRQAIDCLEFAQNTTGTAHRNVIAHIMRIAEEDKPRLGKNRIVASLQPRWMEYDTEVESYAGFMGKERMERCYPNRSLSDNGAVIAYGTDYPVTPPPDPFHGIQVAMTRAVIPGTPNYEYSKGKVLGPNQDGSADLVTLEEAVRCSSRNGAYEMFLENVTGTIAPGMSAELILLDRDLAACPVEEIWNTRVLRTLFRGKTVHRAEA